MLDTHRLHVSANAVRRPGVSALTVDGRGTGAKAGQGWADPTRTLRLEIEIEGGRMRGCDGMQEQGWCFDAEDVAEDGPRSAVDVSRGNYCSGLRDTSW